MAEKLNIIFFFFFRNEVSDKGKGTAVVTEYNLHITSELYLTFPRWSIAASSLMMFKISSSEKLRTFIADLTSAKSSESLRPSQVRLFP